MSDKAKTSGSKVTSKPPAPVDSAAVILLRAYPSETEAQVLLVRRHVESSSFAGAFVFPGGHVDDRDTDSRLLEAVSGLSRAAARETLGEELSDSNALAFWVTAIRELFEEAGVLLATRADGRPVDFSLADTASRFAAAREKLCRGEEDLAEFVAREKLRLTAGALAYFSRWITPVTAPSRFDTRFFVSISPSGQKPLHDDHEVTDARWLSPSCALSEAAKGDLLLFPPTVRTLEELAALGSPKAIVADARARCVSPILPKIVTVNDAPVILLPGDAAYQQAEPGKELPPVRGPRSRMGVVEGTWRSLS